MREKKLLTVQNMVLVAMFTAILSICSQIAFQLPGGVPVTLQTFSIVLIGIMLGPKLGLISVLLYMLIGAVGVPVFSNLHGGLNVLVGPTGGYIFGFLPMVFLTGLGKGKSFFKSIAFSIIGLLICHVMGLYMYYLVTNTWLLPSVPLMLAKDITTTVLAIIFGKEVSRRLSFLSLSVR
ncbi:MAG: hypothetical protein K0S61_3350 [Anaerocolumna sp.]|jgi:biotin transport system substrate-specific component|nr:hypothetical protein [Anaerocolumna sp.]